MDKAELVLNFRWYKFMNLPSPNPYPAIGELWAPENVLFFFLVLKFSSALCMKSFADDMLQPCQVTRGNDRVYFEFVDSFEIDLKLLTIGFGLNASGVKIVILEL
jgi:hypothetical protein